jgi:hypothetical protein
MKRILKFLARLYPLSWRKRYGAEYEALLEDASPKARDMFDVVQGAVQMQITNRTLLSVVSWSALIGMLAAIAISFAMHERYVSRTLISITATDVPSAGHALDVELSSVKDDLLSADSLSRIIQQDNLYPRERTRVPIEEVIQQMRRDINIRPVRVRNDDRPVLHRKDERAFVLDFSYPDGHMAQRVDSQLASLFAESGVRNRMNHPAEASDPHVTFSVDEPATPASVPDFPKRGEFAVGGLLAGLISGFISAILLRSDKANAANV